MKILFYILYGFFALLGLYFVISSFTGHFTLGRGSQGASKVVLLIGALTGGATLYWAYQLGEVQGRGLAGVGAVLLAVVAFQLPIVLGSILLR